MRPVHAVLVLCTFTALCGCAWVKPPTNRPSWETASPSGYYGPGFIPASPTSYGYPDTARQMEKHMRQDMRNFGGGRR